MDIFLPGLIIGFREGLEAFMIVTLLIQYLKRSNNDYLRRSVFIGTGLGIIASMGVGGLLFLLTNALGNREQVANIWESGASLLALGLVTAFIYWMITHGRNMVASIEQSVSKKLSSFGVASVAFVMVVREGVEIAIFSFAGKYTLISLAAGISGALLVTALVVFSLIKVNMRVLFNVTLAYLIFQAGFLLGYGIHEGLSAFHAMNLIVGDSPLLIKLFDLSQTVFYHKEGIIGLPLYVLFGWYSKPEVLQFFAQYIYTVSFLVFWHRVVKRKSL